MRVPSAAGAAAIVAVLTMQACGGAGPAPAPAPANAADAARLAELEALYRAREDSARTRYNEADVRFMQGMIVHHAQALAMSELAPSHGASPSLRTLTARTINAQSDEIQTMSGWLEDRGETVPQFQIHGAELTVEGVDHDMTMMPGMLTAEQMRQLDAARGERFDRLFLTFMIQHHTGAVTMVHELFGTPGAALGDLTFKIASDIQVDQTTEIHRMQLMLAAMPDELSPR